MTRTITALFDKRSDAEAAEARLKAANVDASHISIHDQSSAGFSASAALDPYRHGHLGVDQERFPA